MFEHLWAHVVRGAGKGRREVRGPLEDPGDTKVSKLDHIVLQEDIPTNHKICNISYLATSHQYAYNIGDEWELFACNIKDFMSVMHMRCLSTLHQNIIKLDTLAFSKIKVENRNNTYVLVAVF